MRVKTSILLGFIPSMLMSCTTGQVEGGSDVTKGLEDLTPALSNQPVTAWNPVGNPEYIIIFENPVSLDDLQPYNLNYRAAQYIKLDILTTLTMPKQGKWVDLSNEYRNYNNGYVQRLKETDREIASKLSKDMTVQNLSDLMFRSQVKDIIEGENRIREFGSESTSGKEVFMVIVTAPKEEIEKLSREMPGVNFSNSRTFVPMPDSVAKMQAEYQDGYMPPLDGLEKLDVTDYEKIRSEFTRVAEDIHGVEVK